MTQTIVRGYTENSGSITIPDDLNGDITIAPSGSGEINCSSTLETLDIKTSTTKKVYSRGNCAQTQFHNSLIFSF